MKKLFSLVLLALMLCASTSAQMKSYVQKDSLSSENKPLKSCSPSLFTIMGEVFIGPLAGVVTAVPVYFLFSGSLENGGGGPLHHDYDYGVVGVIGAAYVVGTAIGVNLFARADNPEVTFGGTLLGSIIGAGAGIGAAALINKGEVIKEGRSAGNYVLLFAPLIGSMVYANFVSPHPKATDYSSNLENYRSIALSNSHKDLYNSTLQYRMNLFTIAF